MALYSEMPDRFSYNGDMGIITAVDPESRAVTVQMDDRKYIYGADQLAELEPAYAVTVHKSQGSEFPAVIMPVADVPARLCYRNLLYTGVTRARRLCSTRPLCSQMICGLSGAGGFKMACRRRFSSTLPVGPTLVGQSTWMSRTGS